MNAYDFLKLNIGQQKLDEDSLNKLKETFQNDYLSDKRFYERKTKHRNHTSVANELLRDLNTYLLQLQNRDEMRDLDLEKKCDGLR